MKLLNEEIGLSIELDKALLDKLYEIGSHHYPKEFGGLLLGYYSDDEKTVIIKDTLLPIKYKSSKYSFERGNEGLKVLIEHFFGQEPSLFYIGEWHTHPDNPAIPSFTDLNALREIVSDKNVLIDSPLLLIMSITNNDYTPCFYVYFKNKVYKYEEIEEML